MYIYLAALVLYSVFRLTDFELIEPINRRVKRPCLSTDSASANKENGSTLKECRHFRQRIRRWQSRIYWQDRVISPEGTLGFVIRRDTAALRL